MSALAYLKGSYRSHVTKRVSTCPTHCLMFALSNPLDRELMTVCDHDHDDICNDCENVFKCLDQVNEMICKSVQDRGVKEEHLYDLEVAVMYITEWMRHILRAAHTQDTKKTILENMDESSAMLIGDWMMKTLPQYFREKMENWFGKRGISGQVHSFIMRQGNSYKKATYFTFADKCSQDGYTSTCVFEHDIKAFMKDFPKIKSLYCRNNNATCYSGSSVLMAKGKFATDSD